MLGAEIAFATGETQAARAKVVRLLEQPETEAAIATRAHILLGRIDRLSDLSAARDSFEAALATATAAHAPVQVLDALHELGTIELLGFAGTTRLLQARATAAHIGAMGTVAVIDLQLTAAYLSRFDTGAAERHAAAAYEVADRLGLHAVAAKALCGLAETQVQRCQPAEMERLLGLALGRDPSEPFTEAFGWGQCRGMLALFEDDWPRALDCFGRGVALLAGVVNPEPVEFRALWPLLLAGLGDERAAGALESARRAADLHIAFCNRGLLGYASAVLAGRTGDRVGAEELAVRADAYLARFPFWGDLARLCAAPGAERDGWGQPQLWLATAEPTFARLGLAALARRCRALPQAGLTHREAEVLALVSEGLSNKQIGAQLHLSPRTVEKHVESLLRKTSRASRTQLALWRAGRNT
jgi:DNA-binding CsgD family transcriptional regulator